MFSTSSVPVKNKKKLTWQFKATHYFNLYFLLDKLLEKYVLRRIVRSGHFLSKKIYFNEITSDKSLFVRQHRQTLCSFSHDSKITVTCPQDAVGVRNPTAYEEHVTGFTVSVCTGLKDGKVLHERDLLLVARCMQAKACQREEWVP